MLRTLTVSALLVVFCSPAVVAQRTAAVGTDISYLASDRLEGRGTGYPGADLAAEFLASRFAELGLQPVDGLDGWFHRWEISPTAPAVQGTPIGGRPARNVVGWLPGADPTLAREYLILGAHYDHLGLGGSGSRDPDSTGVVHNGADDNASGVAALLEVARRLQAERPGRSVLFIAFSGEELGLLGATAFVREAPVPLDRAVAMLNFDMVGRLRDDRLIINGVETATEFRGLLDSLNTAAGFALTATGNGYGPSDHAAFTPAGLPVLHFFTGTHEDYHRTTDDSPTINVEGVERIAAFAADLSRVLGREPARLTFVASTAPAPVGGSRSGGYGAWLGSIPDMSDNPGGVRISGVSGGSPADQAGLRAGDIITRIGDYPVPDLQGMTTALRSYQPGDAVDVVIRRDGTEQVIKVTLGRRGG